MEKKVTAINPHILYNHTHTPRHCLQAAGCWDVGRCQIGGSRKQERESYTMCFVTSGGVGLLVQQPGKRRKMNFSTHTPEVKCSQHKVERSHIFLEKYKNHQEETMSERVRVLMSFFPGHMCRPCSSVSHFTSVPDGIGFFSLSTGTHCGYE